MLLLENQPPPLTPQEGEAEEAMIWSRRRIVCRRCSVQEELLLLLLPRGAAAAAYNRLWTRAEIKVGYSRQEAEDEDAIYRHRERERFSREIAQGEEEDAPSSLYRQQLPSAAAAADELTLSLCLAGPTCPPH